MTDLKAYKGDQPYIFISYAHKDSERIMPMLGRFMNDGYRVWFDEGIEAGEDWAEIIGENLENASCLIAFITANYMESINCRNELEFARNEKIPTIMVYLEQVKESAGFRLNYSTLNKIFCSQYGTGDRLFGKLYSSSLMDFAKSQDSQSKADELMRADKKCYGTEEYGSSFRYFSEAAEMGDAEAQYMLGQCYYCGDDTVKDPEKAYKWLRKAAEQGHVDAQLTIGYGYHYGYGVIRDSNEAYKYFRMAAEQSSPEGQYMLGVCYDTGRGTNKDSSKAFMWYKKAAEAGIQNPPQDNGIRYCFEKGADKKTPKFYGAFIRAAKHWDVMSWCKLGEFYFDGTGTAQNYAEALRWYRLAAEHGDANSMCKVGECYYHGYGTDKDMTESEKWLRMAAKLDGGDAKNMLCQWFASDDERNFPEAQYDLGISYSSDGDHEKALRCYISAAEKGHAEAQYELGNMFLYGWGTKQCYTEAFKWFSKAAEQGHADAQYELGYCCYYGFGTEMNQPKASEWYRKSAEQGNERAVNKCKELGIKF